MRVLLTPQGVPRTVAKLSGNSLGRSFESIGELFAVIPIANGWRLTRMTVLRVLFEEKVMRKFLDQASWFAGLACFAVSLVMSSASAVAIGPGPIAYSNCPDPFPCGPNNCPPAVPLCGFSPTSPQCTCF